MDADGSAIVPSHEVVYTVSLASDDGGGGSSGSSTQPIAVPLSISVAGAYTLLVSHGIDEVPQAVVSPTGEALVPAATEEAGEHEDGDDEDGDDSVTARQWAEALTASFLVSMCR